MCESDNYYLEEECQEEENFDEWNQDISPQPQVQPIQATQPWVEETMDNTLYPSDNDAIDQMREWKHQNPLKDSYLVIRAEDYTKLRKTAKDRRPYPVLHVSNNSLYDYYFNQAKN